MPAYLGQHLGAVDSIESLRLRCVCNDGDDCWHLRSARGRPMKKGQPHTIRVFGVGRMTVGRAIWHLQGKYPPRASQVVHRTCDSYDCANPEHFKCSVKSSFQRTNMTGPVKGARKEALAAERLRQTKITPELRRWAFESQQSGREVAHAIGCAPARVNAVRRAMRAQPVASVFHLGALEWRKAA